MFQTDLLLCYFSYVDCQLADCQHNYMRNTNCHEYSINTPDDGQ